MQTIRLSVWSANARTTVYCNDFPVLLSKRGSVLRSLNPYLLEQNTLTINVVPEEGAHLTLRVAPQDNAQEVYAADKQPGLVNVNEDIPAEKKYLFTFATPGQTLGKRFLGPKVNMDDALDYARKIAMLLIQKNAERLAAEMQPKFEFETQYFGTPLQDNIEGLRVILNDFTFTFDLNKITLEPYCSGRVVRLLHNGDVFISSKSPTESVHTDIYVANVNGTLKVIE